MIRRAGAAAVLALVLLGSSPAAGQAPAPAPPPVAPSPAFGYDLPPGTGFAGFTGTGADVVAHYEDGRAQLVNR